jgi:hypothetical protein
MGFRVQVQLVEWHMDAFAQSIKDGVINNKEGLTEDACNIQWDGEMRVVSAVLKYMLEKSKQLIVVEEGKDWTQTLVTFNPDVGSVVECSDSECSDAEGCDSEFDTEPAVANMLPKKGINLRSFQRFTICGLQRAIKVCYINRKTSFVWMGSSSPYLNVFHN